MGRLNIRRKRTLRAQITFSFHLILVFSVTATLITWGLIILAFSIYSKHELMKPANYYESKIPELLHFIYKQRNILPVTNKDTLNKLIPLEGLDYQVVDIDGDFMYGSMGDSYISSSIDLATNINKNKYDGQRIIQYYPIFDENQAMNGAIGFRYKLSLASSNPQSSMLFIGIGVIIFLAPFVYFYLFSFLIGKQFSSRIEKPFNEIIESAHKIQQHDLNFSLSHIESTVELNKLVAAFEEMKEALKESLKRQWKLEEDRRDMIATVAHDLKTPLTIILGHVEGLLEVKEHHPDRLERYLLTIQSSCIRTIQLIKELNDVSQIEQVEFKLNFTVTNMENWIQSKVNEYELLCKSKNIKFDAVIDKKEDAEVWIDLFRINQVLDNVITNSLNYTPEYGEMKWITTITDQQIVFEILDNGPGFSNKNMSQIFNKFYREDISRTSKTGHSGLGLFIVQTITEKHGGKILAQNRVEGGAYVKIEIQNMRGVSLV
ncbi:ATP-binding protein [Psychrobacillus sp. NPDC096389]|uniref:sensor histidine kinase n=1 Tax=Psychrobacillus sp. NPDC096389 TaxID=3364490 RepID=UPI0037F84176